MLPNILSAFIAPALLLSSLAQGAAQADNKTDIGPAISAAFTQCASAGKATLYIPPGSYSLATGVKLNKGSAYAFQIDGLITLTSNGAFSGNAFVLQNCQDVEVFSSNGPGAINGQGYITRLTKSGQNARLFRFINAVNIAIHDIIFVDSSTFHLVFNGVSNMEAYHITIRGPSIGGTDGIDVACSDNCYLHDLEVTNRDECISVKSPSNNVLMEDIICNQSGGMSIGSLDGKAADNGGEAAAVSNITMRNIYVYQCTQMLMIKTYPGGSGGVGFVKDSLFENFWAYDTTYALDIDQYWQQTVSPDTGAVELSNLAFRNWTGTVNNGVSRAPIVICGSAIVPITDISLSGFDMWTINGNKILNQCKNVYGSGYCARPSIAGQKLTTFTTTATTTAPPAAFTSPTKPKWGIQGYGVTIPIPVYTPAPLWAVSSGSGAVSSQAVVSSTSSSVPAATSKVSTPSRLAVSSTIKTSRTMAVVLTTKPIAVTTTTKVATTSAVAGGTLARWAQCGGQGWTGTGTCETGSKCVVSNNWYSQCL